MTGIQIKRRVAAVCIVVSLAILTIYAIIAAAGLHSVPLELCIAPTGSILWGTLYLRSTAPETTPKSAEKEAKTGP